MPFSEDDTVNCYNVWHGSHPVNQLLYTAVYNMRHIIHLHDDA